MYAVPIKNQPKVDGLFPLFPVFVQPAAASFQPRPQRQRRRGQPRPASKIRRRPHPVFRYPPDFEVRTDFQKNSLPAVVADPVPGHHRGRDEADVGGQTRQAHVEAGSGSGLTFSSKWYVFYLIFAF